MKRYKIAMRVGWSTAGAWPLDDACANLRGMSGGATTWDRLWPVLLAASLAFAAAMLVQLVIVPRVEQHKRREDRWEVDVRDLGEHLSFAVTETSSGHISAIGLHEMVRE
jgi:hypothetical protein